MNEIKTYNEQGFLVPHSMKSSAIYHAKIKPDGTYRFRIHDCINGIRLIGDLNDPEDVVEALQKLRCLAGAAGQFADFIEANYTTKAKEYAKIRLDRRIKSPAYTEIPSILSAGIDGAIPQLNPLFVEEMMGFPTGWILTPFLKESQNPDGPKPTTDGEQKLSKH